MRDRGYFVSMAMGYCRDVLSGKIPACVYVKQACQRQLDDLVKSKGSTFNYRFDIDAAERVCQFVEMLPHVKGEWANRRELLKLEPWQAFILTTIFGWLNKDTGYRRFRIVYTEVPRKNAKSSLSSAVALYMLSADGEEGSDVFSAATSKEQAKIVFNDALMMVNRAPSIQKDLGVAAFKYEIKQDSTGSKFRSLSRDQSGNLDGLNIHCAIVDELHGHKTRGTWDVLVTGIGARAQPLIWAITTAGFDRNGICYEQRTYTTKILERTAEDDSFFGIIYTIDKGDDWRDPNVWPKANPNWGVSVRPDNIASEAVKAIAMSNAQNNFLTKHLNVWVNAATAWMNMAAWEDCADPLLDIDDFERDKVPCIISADLASKKDFASVARIFKKMIDGKEHYYIFVKHYLNEQAAFENSNDSIAGWINDDLIVLSEGNTTDLNQIEADIIADCGRYNVIDVCLDPMNAAQMIQNLQNKNIKVVEYTNNLANMSEPTKLLEALVLDKRLHHDGDPVLSWMVSNVVAHLDAKDNIFPKRDRTQPHNKIDGAIATIMGIGRHMQEKTYTPEFKVFVFNRRRR